MATSPLDRPESVWELARADAEAQFVSRGPPTEPEVPLVSALARAASAHAGAGASGLVSLRLRQGLLIFSGPLSAAEDGAVVRLVELDPISGRALVVGRSAPQQPTLPWLLHRAIPEASVALIAPIAPPGALADAALPAVSPSDFLRPSQWVRHLPALRAAGALRVGPRLLLWDRDGPSLLGLLSGGGERAAGGP